MAAMWQQEDIAEVSEEDIVKLMVGREIDKSEWGVTHATDEVLMSVKGLCSGKNSGISVLI